MMILPLLYVFYMYIIMYVPWGYLSPCLNLHKFRATFINTAKNIPYVQVSCGVPEVDYIGRCTVCISTHALEHSPSVRAATCML